MNESEAHQAQIDVEYHLRNFLRAMFSGNEPLLGEFKPTGRLSIMDADRREHVIDITSPGVYDCNHYMNFLFLALGGEGKFMEAMQDYMTKYPGVHRSWNSEPLLNKWQQVYELGKKLAWAVHQEDVVQREDESLHAFKERERQQEEERNMRAHHEMYVTLQEMGLYALPAGLSFKYYQWCYNTHQYIRTDMEVVREHVRKALYARVCDEKVVKAVMPQLKSYILKYRQVEAVSRLAGFNPGLNPTPDDTKMLCPKGPSRKIIPREGEFDLVISYLRGRFCQEQIPYLIGWLSQCVKKLYAHDRDERDYLTHAAVFMGDTGIGKSTFQEKFLTALFWGRYVDFSNELTGSAKGEFNASRGKAEHLLVGDFALGDMSAARVSERITGMIKAVTANGSYALTGKGMDSVTVPNRNILTISTNMEPKNIRVWPDLEDKSAEGKMHIFLFDKHETEFTYAQWEDMMKQLPGFLYYLLHLNIDPDRRWLRTILTLGKDENMSLPSFDQRFGIGSFIHPLAKELRQDISDAGKNEYDDMTIRALGRLLKCLNKHTDWCRKGISVGLMKAIIHREVEIPNVTAEDHKALTESLRIVTYTKVTRGGGGRLSLPGLMYAFTELSDDHEQTQRSLNIDIVRKKTRGIRVTSDHQPDQQIEK